MSEAWQVDSAEPGVMINNITISIMLLARLPPITITLIREAFRKRKSHVSSLGEDQPTLSPTPNNHHLY